MANIRCPFHDDTRASMKVYGDVAWCFVCHMSVPVTELNLPARIISSKEITDIKKEWEYIKSLPKKLIRGLEMPYDNRGFYVLWPNKMFYKKRLNEGKTRYIAPSGHKPPLYVCPGENSHLLVVEGELNAASIHRVKWDEYKIVSPGSAGEFLRHLEYYLQYPRITLVLDKDAAGIVHGLQIKEILLKHKKDTRLVLVSKDFSSILETQGEDSLREYFERVV